MADLESVATRIAKRRLGSTSAKSLEKQEDQKKIKASSIAESIAETDFSNINRDLDFIYFL